MDASVLIAALSPKEVRHIESRDFIKELHRRGVLLKEPAQFLLELYAVMLRSTEAARYGRELWFLTEENRIQMNLIALDEVEIQRFLLWMSSAMAGQSPTRRGADLAYACVAKKRGLPLVTLDNGLHKFAAAGLEVYSPSDLLAIWRKDKG